MAPPVSHLVGGLWVAMRLAQWDSQVPWATANSRFLDALGEGKGRGRLPTSKSPDMETVFEMVGWGGVLGWLFHSSSFFVFQRIFWVKKWSNLMITRGTTLFERRGVSFHFLDVLVDRLGLQLLLSLYLFAVWNFMLPLSRTSAYLDF